MAPAMNPPRKVKKHGRERWLVDLREHKAGRRFFDDEASAKRFITETLLDLEAHGQLAFDLPPDQRRRYLALDRQATELGTTIEQALEWWKKTHKPHARKPLGEAIKECIDAKRAAGRRFRTLEQLGYTLKSLSDCAGAKLICSELSHEILEKWLRNPDWGQRTRKGKLVDARTFISFCLKRGWMMKDPSEAVEPFTLDLKPPGILTVGQVKGLLLECRKQEPKLLPWLVLGVFAGIRPDEIKCLSWANVDLKSAYVEITAEVAKNRRQRRLVKLQPNAVEWLSLGGDLPPTNWRRRWIRVRTFAGFKIEHRANGVIWPHDAMRHSFCSYALPIFGTVQTTQWAGHSEAMLFDHYRELVKREEAEKFWKLTPEAVAKESQSREEASHK